MATPGEHKTVQARILAYAREVGWVFVPRGEAERRREGIPLHPKVVAELETLARSCKITFDAAR
jgi:LDH2 family malate/lactate/ureidoglycolate dehydrogenase